MKLVIPSMGRSQCCFPPERLQIAFVARRPWSTRSKRRAPECRRGAVSPVHVVAQSSLCHADTDVFRPAAR